MENRELEYKLEKLAWLLINSVLEKARTSTVGQFIAPFLDVIETELEPTNCLHEELEQNLAVIFNYYFDACNTKIEIITAKEHFKGVELRQKNLDPLVLKFKSLYEKINPDENLDIKIDQLLRIHLDKVFSQPKFIKNFITTSQDLINAFAVLEKELDAIIENYKDSRGSSYTHDYKEHHKTREESEYKKSKSESKTSEEKGFRKKTESKEKHKSENYYEFLGIKSNATEKEIKKAYYAASKKYHPDTGGSEDMMKKVNEAYSVLKDKVKREQYDKENGFK